MDVRGFEIYPAFLEESAGIDPSFLPGSKRRVPDEVAALRSQALPARAVRNAGAVKPADWPQKTSTFVFILL